MGTAPVNIAIFVAAQQGHSAFRALEGKQEDGTATRAEPKSSCLHALPKSGGCAFCLIPWGVKLDGLSQLCTVQAATIVQEAQASPFFVANLEQDMPSFLVSNFGSLTSFLTSRSGDDAGYSAGRL